MASYAKYAYSVRILFNEAGACFLHRTRHHHHRYTASASIPVDTCVTHPQPHTRIVPGNEILIRNFQSKIMLIVCCVQVESLSHPLPHIKCIISFVFVARRINYYYYCMLSRHIARRSFATMPPPAAPGAAAATTQKS